MQRHPAAVAGAAAGRAALGPVQHEVVGLARLDREADERELLRARHVGLLAALAQRAAQPLGDHAVQRGPDQERLDAHLDQAGHRRRRVVGVQRREHQVTGERGLDGDVGRLVVADLADQHDVGVRAQDRAQRAGEGQAGLGVGLHLVDAGQAVLHRVLDRDHVDVLLVEDVERGVERRRLARPGRTGHQDHPVGLGVRRLEPREVAGTEPQVGQAEPGVGVVEHTRDDLLPPHRRQRRHTQVDRLPEVAHREPPVLGDPPLGDVHVGHDLQPAHDPAQDAARGPVGVAEHAVDAVADPQVLLGRLEVDVGGLVGDRLGDQQVHEPHHRGVLGDLGESVEVVVDLLDVVGEVDAEVGELALGTVGLVEPLLDLRGPRQREAHPLAGQPRDVVLEREVEHQADRGGHDQLAVAPAHRDDPGPAREVARQQGGRRGVQRQVGELEEVHAAGLGAPPEQLGPVHGTRAHQRGQHLAARASQRAGLLDLGGRHLALGEQLLDGRAATALGSAVRSGQRGGVHGRGLGCGVRDLEGCA